MTTKELENKLKISENTCIHCSTLELAKQVLSIFHKLGLKWCNGIAYTKCTDWDSYKENTIYYPFEGRFSSLAHAQQINCKIISAEEFITLHTEEFNLENYVPKGELEGFPKEIIARILDCQEEQGNKRDISVFENNKFSLLEEGGFDWDKTKEEDFFWYEVICNKDFNLFFEKYPKKEDNQEFRVGDKVYDIILGKIGIIKEIILNDGSAFPIEVYYENCGIVLYTLEGKYSSIDKHPSLLHYRDDYDYDVIDFNNLPKRQEPKRWRAERNRLYYFINFYTKDWFFSDETKDCYDPIDNENYNSGNYFRTEVEAEIIAQKLNSYFKQLIKEEHDTHRN